MQTTTINIPKEKIDQFKKDGYFILESVIPGEHVKLLREVCQSAIDETDAEMDRQGTDVKGINHRGKRYFMKAEPNHPRIREFIFSDLMASITHTIFGDEIYYKSDQYVVKFDKTGMEFSWHQDSGYAQARLGDHPEILSCWCTLDEVNEDNGTVYLLPMSRYGEKKLAEHIVEEGSNDRIGYFGDDPGEPVIAPAGSIAVFSSLTFHRSGANPTGKKRRVYLAQYTASPMPGEQASDANERFIKDGHVQPNLY